MLALWCAMRIVENTKERLVVRGRRRIGPDLGLSAMIVLGGIFALGLVLSEPGWLEIPFITLGLVFVGFGVAGLLDNAVVTATFDDADARATLHWRKITGPVFTVIPFAEIEAILVRSDSDEDTIDIALHGGETVALEKVTTEDRRMVDVAQSIRAWLHDRGALSG